LSIIIRVVIPYNFDKLYVKLQAYIPRVIFHGDKMNNYFFQKMNSFFNFEITYVSIIYYKYCDMSNEIIQSIAYDNYDDFQHINHHIFTNFHFTIFRII
jgi:hypothetical protein